MAEYLIQDTTLQAIADAIKEKLETTDVILVSDMATKILSIESNPIGFDFNDENLVYYAYMLDPSKKQIIIYSINYDKIYEITGSYDVNIPDQIGGYNVVLSCEEV